MREMKDSGVEWIGEIPCNWSVKQGKYLFSLAQKPVKDEDGIITCFRDGEVTLRSNRREEGFTESLKEIGYQGIDAGDLIVHGMDGFSGSIGISDSRGKASPVLNVLETSENKRYYMYYLRAAAWSGLFISLATGIRVRTCDTNWGKLRTIFYLQPTCEEQKRIADYLDSKYAEIDTLSADIQSEIDTLEAYKKSAITEAVTKGLNPNVHMKDSGTGWMGDVPELWNKTRVKYCLQEVNERSIAGEEEPLSMSQKLGLVPTTMINVPHIMATYVGAKIARPNDLVLNKLKAHLGVFSVSQYTGLVSPDYAVYQAYNNTNPKYLEYLFKTDACINELKKYITGVGQGLSRLYTKDLFRIAIAIPSRDEQDCIVEHLNRLSAEIDAIVKQKQEQLAILADYKKALIYEYVTGKKEVPADV